MIDGIKPVLDLLDPQQPVPNRRHPEDIVVEKCKSALEHFKQYAHGIACSSTGHALAVIRSVYPSVKLERIDSGYARNLSDKQITALEEEVSESAIKLASDLVLFDDADKEP